MGGGGGEHAHEGNALRFVSVIFNYIYMGGGEYAHEGNTLGGQKKTPVSLWSWSYRWM